MARRRGLELTSVTWRFHGDLSDYGEILEMQPATTFRRNTTGCAWTDRDAIDWVWCTAERLTLLTAAALTSKQPAPQVYFRNGVANGRDAPHTESISHGQHDEAQMPRQPLIF